SVSTAMKRTPAMDSVLPNDLCGINATIRGVRFEDYGARMTRSRTLGQDVTTTNAIAPRSVHGTLTARLPRTNGRTNFSRSAALRMSLPVHCATEHIFTVDVEE